MTNVYIGRCKTLPAKNEPLAKVRLAVVTCNDYSTGYFSSHIEHFDSSVNGYAIAEFTKDKMQWDVYAIDKTAYKKTDDGRNLSTDSAEKKLVLSATYKPDDISLYD